MITWRRRLRKQKPIIEGGHEGPTITPTNPKKRKKKREKNRYEDPLLSLMLSLNTRALAEAAFAAAWNESSTITLDRTTGALAA
jgi:hypothetical protein